MTFKLTSKFDLGLRANTSVDRLSSLFLWNEIGKLEVDIELIQSKGLTNDNFLPLIELHSTHI